MAKQRPGGAEAPEALSQHVRPLTATLKALEHNPAMRAMILQAQNCLHGQQTDVKTHHSVLLKPQQYVSWSNHPDLPQVTQPANSRVKT